ncbi:sugar ABC transporter ATP-binding protein [Hydrogenophaga sp.]|uniref:sugar ABC transporter ATP-binding protein n=1 Tax=Hydrogenophaga sp. TaxID=1904254 RepID=UPI002731D25F|nr:sugar ABC transporter ATP-binding protein [Hydrogenophaga sp.]MDP2016041.1 sugar ABC transporter ATP-binding protein [Hydrogenophaga sp.]MDP3167969.1 sugar ABC transporter ATP-binding protein [Hydrogenophaga sp.]
MSAALGRSQASSHRSPQGEGTPVSGASLPVLELRGITKRFPGVLALDQVSLQLFPGEVHMLMGENGAGKSTLMKVLCGAYTADEGEILSEGQPVAVRNAADARALGVAVIFQEYSLVPHLNIAQNIYLGREPLNRLGLIDRVRMHADARAVMARLNLDLDTHREVHGLGVAQQQMVEIAKALSQKARVLVLDEPTAALSDRETAKLFEVIAELRRQGVAMVYISHRMDEVFSLGDRVTVLRDGKYVATLPAGEATPDQLVTLMVGRKVDMSYQRAERPVAGACLLDVRGISAANGIRDVSLKVHAGEIVGLSGLVGSGRTEVARAIFGADAITVGDVRFDGAPLGSTPMLARRAGLGLIPESRKQQGLALARTVCDNLLLAGLGKLFPSRLYRPRKAHDEGRKRIEQLRIATPGPHTPAQSLSGGNQQKIVIGKWLVAGTRLFIFDEPTRGIDVGAKEEIFRLIDQLVHQGCAVLMISSELGEVVRVCDRAYVMKDRTVAGELQRDQLSEANLLRLAMHHG